MPKLSGNGNGLQCQSCCLDVYVIASWNQMVAANSNSCLDVQTYELLLLKSLNIIPCSTCMKI